MGERKLCGSAQVHREGAVLQHGSILLERLGFDETDLLHGAHDRAALHEVTVTLAELGAPTDVHDVADAVVAGFAAALDLRFISKSRPAESARPRHLVDVEAGR